jgi:predicted secreted hydrolase
MPETPDLHGHPELENEWWYYHGHLFGGGRRFGFHLAFFRRRTDRVQIGRIIPVELVSPQIRFAHFSLTDVGRQEFRYGHQRSIRPNAGEATDQFRVWMRRWSAAGTNEVQRLVAAIRGVEFELEVKPTKPAERHGLSGYRTGESGQIAVYFSYPRMEAAGRIKIDGQTVDVTGEAWMDRDYGHFTFDRHLRGWDWFAIQLDDGRELMIFRMRDHLGGQSPHSLATLIDKDGSARPLPANEIKVQPLTSWTSSASGNSYPVSWQVHVGAIGADLHVSAMMQNQELDTRGSTSLIYWEGPADVTGTLGGNGVQGRGYMELVGYGDPHRFGTYDFETDNIDLLGWAVNEFRLRAFGPGVRVSSRS